jgi:hypothetical protein
MFWYLVAATQIVYVVYITDRFPKQTACEVRIREPKSLPHPLLFNWVLVHNRVLSTLEHFRTAKSAFKGHSSFSESSASIDEWTWRVQPSTGVLGTSTDWKLETVLVLHRWIGSMTTTSSMKQEMSVF